jgi:hypothetical protein
METSNYTNETCKRRLSVMVGCYGNYPHYSVRAVESLLKHCVSRDNFELFVGCNESGADVIQQFRKHLDLEQHRYIGGKPKEYQQGSDDASAFGMLPDSLSPLARR